MRNRLGSRCAEQVGSIAALGEPLCGGALGNSFRKQLRGTALGSSFVEQAWGAALWSRSSLAMQL